MLLGPTSGEDFEKIRLIPGFAGHDLVKVSKTGSTNDDLKSAWERKPGISRILLADHQTGGRGLFDRTWIDRAGHALLFSFTWTFHPEGKPDFPVPLAAGLALFRAISKESRKDSQLWLKWPNDLFLGTRKMAGILSEAVSAPGAEGVVIGIGVNLVPFGMTDEMKAQGAVVPAFLQEVASDSCFPGLLFGILSEWGTIASPTSDSSSLLAEYNQAAGPFFRARFSLETPAGETLICTPKEVTRNGTLWVSGSDGKTREFSSVRRLTLSSID